MRVVVDTNVLVSALLKETSTSAATMHLVAQSHTLLKSAATEQEASEVVARPYLMSLIPRDAAAWLRSLLGRAELVVIEEQVLACRDPADDKFLALAINGRAEVIVSGDADLLVLHPFRSIPVISPAAFIRDRARE